MEYWLASQSPSDLASHTLAGDRLVIVHEADGRRDELLFSDIRTINLQHTLGAYVMRITRDSGRDIIIRSRYVAGRGWEDRVAVYAALVTELHEAVQVEDRPIQFVGGSTPFYWTGWAILAIGFAFVALFLWARLTGHAAPPRSLLPVIALGIVGGVAAIRQGRAVPYDPRAPGTRLVPCGSDLQK